MTAPIRIQLRRTRGWRMPENTVKVDRSTPLGNPFVVGRDGNREYCVYLYRRLTSGFLSLTTKATIEEQKRALTYIEERIHELRGKNLACWCSLPKSGEPDHCHAAVQLEMANQEPK